MGPADVLRAQTVAFSLGAALLYALTSVLQQSAAAEVDHGHSLRPGLIVALVKRPRWLLGNLTEVGAYGLQFIALRRGSLLLAETVLVSGLLFALPLGAAVSHRRLQKRDWLGALAVVFGLAIFLAVGVPTRGRGKAPIEVWLVILGLGCALVLTLIATAPKAPGKARATHLGAACGVLFGLNAALTKTVSRLFSHGVVHALSAWEPYVLASLALMGFILAQSAFQAGPLDASLPILTISQPVVAALIGVLAFHERMASNPMAVVAELAAGVAMVAGVATLSRSPLIALHPAESTSVGSTE